MMKSLVACLFVLYVLVQHKADVMKFRYEGMPKKVVEGLVKETVSEYPGATYKFVTKQVFDAVIDPQVDLPPFAARERAISDAKDKSKTTDERLDALIKAIDLK